MGRIGKPIFLLTLASQQSQLIPRPLTLCQPLATVILRALCDGDSISASLQGGSKQGPETSRIVPDITQPGVLWDSFSLATKRVCKRMCLSGFCYPPRNPLSPDWAPHILPEWYRIFCQPRLPSRLLHLCARGRVRRKSQDNLESAARGTNEPQGSSRLRLVRTQLVSVVCQHTQFIPLIST